MYLEKKHTYELSHDQKRFWIQSQMDPQSNALNQPIAIRIRQNVDSALLELALHKLIERHFILRTIFKVVNGEPRQIILSKLIIKVPVFDLTDMILEKSLDLANKEILNDVEKPFDLEEGPLLRASIYKIAEEDSIFYICMHHIIEDGWSIDLFFQELFIIYQALREKQQIKLPDLPIQYIDFAHWQNERVSMGKLQKQRDYWIEKLGGELPSVNLPVDFNRPITRSAPSAKEKIVIESEVYQKLKKLNAEYGTTMFMTIVACLNVLLSKVANQDEIIIGTPIAGRNNKNFKGLIGPILNTLVLRNHLSKEITFSEFLQQVKKNCIEAYANQDYPFDKLLQDLNITRQKNRAPLFDVLINFASNYNGEASLGEMEVERFEIGDTEKNEFDLTVIVEIVNDHMVITLNYATDIFNEDSIVRIGENFQKIIANVAENPDNLVWEIDYLSIEEKEVLHDINNTRMESSNSSTIPSLFVKQMFKTPDAICINQEHKHLTYKALHLQSNKIGNLLHDCEIEPNTLVGVIVNRGINLIATLLGILKARSAYVPIDPDYPKGRVEYLLNDSKCQVLVVEKNYLPVIENYLPKSIKIIICLDTSEKISLYKHERFDGFYKLEKVSGICISEKDLNLTVRENDLAYVMYTSGSSGTPKGVIQTHKSVLNTLLWLQETYPLCEHDVVAQKTTMGFTDSVAEFFWPIIVGAKMAIILSDTVKDTEKLYNCLKDEKVTVTQFVPSHINVFLDVVRSKNGDNPLPHLKWVFYGGEPLSVKIVREWFNNFKSAKLANIYGMTESVAYAINYIIEKKPDKNDRRIPLGLPIKNTHVYILNQYDQIAGFNTQGEICIGGRGITNGYWNKPELTKRAFTTHPLTGERLYRTGDLGCLRPDGMFEYLGRKDDQVKIRGFRVEMKEVENAVVSFPSIKEAAVIKFLEETGLTGLICYFTAKQTDLNYLEIRKYLKEQIPEYMIPSHFMQLEELPLNSHGKVDRKNLPIFNNRNRGESNFHPPKDIIEKALVAIWEEVLEVNEIGIFDDFFDLGGHSLKMARVIFKIREITNVIITYKEFLEHPTIQELGNLMKEKIGAVLN